MKKLLLTALSAILLTSCDRPHLTVQVGIGRNAVTYHTREYRKTGDCIHFVINANAFQPGDSVHACGPYTVFRR